MDFHGIDMVGDFKTDNIKSISSDGITLYDYAGSKVAKIYANAVSNNKFEILNVDIASGLINDAIIGGTTPAAGTFTTVVAGTVDIDGGTIDGTIIGGTTPAAGTFSVLGMNTGTTVTEFSTDDTLAGDSDDALVTEKAIKQYVTNRIAEKDSFLDLEDTPSGYTNAGALINVNDAENALQETEVILTEGTNTFAITKGTSSLDIAAGATLNIDKNFTINGQPTTITGAGQANTLTLNESLTVGNGNDGTLTYSGSNKTLTVENNTVVNQDLTTDADVDFNSVTVDSVTIGSKAITEFSIDGAFAGNSDDAVPTEKAVKTYVDNKTTAATYTPRTINKVESNSGATFIQDLSFSFSSDVNGNVTAASFTADHATISPSTIGALSGSGVNNYVALWNGTDALDSSTISQTKLNYLSDVTSPIQSQLDDKQPLNSYLTQIAELSPSNGDIIYYTDGVWTTTALEDLTMDVNVQRGVLSMTPGYEGSASKTATISEVDMTKSILITTGTPAGYRIYLSSSTEITLIYNDTLATTYYIQWQVIEYI